MKYDDIYHGSNDFNWIFSNLIIIINKLVDTLFPIYTYKYCAFVALIINPLQELDVYSYSFSVQLALQITIKLSFDGAIIFVL